IAGALLLLQLLSLSVVDEVEAREEYAASSTDATLIHRGAFTEQLNLVGADASVEQLALTDDDVQFLGITVDESSGDVYFATSNSAIQRAHYDSAKSPSWDVTTVAGGHVEVRVEGYNLGTSIDDVASFSVKGVECPTRRRESSNTLVCVLGDPAVTSDLGESVETEDIVVQTASGGWTQGGYPGDFVDAKLADHSLKPIITRVEATGRTISPRALCFDSAGGTLYYSDLATRSLNRINLLDNSGDGGSTLTAKVEFDVFLPDVGLVQGMAIDVSEGRNGGFVYFSDAQGGTISRVELPADGTRPEVSEARQVLVSGLIDPMGIALEPDGGRGRLFYALRGGRICAVSRDGSISTSVPPTAVFLEGGGYEVRRFDSGTRLDGIAISASEGGGIDPTEVRLYWAESGRAPAIKRSTLDGTRPEDVSVEDDGTEAKGQLVWPRGLAFGAEASTGLLFGEYLGSVRLLPLPPAGGSVGIIAEADSYPAAVAIHALVAAARREGAEERFFTHSVR
ncbi:unnamed protein product, partial [Ectocarpus sp. 4 AP-2014]